MPGFKPRRVGGGLSGKKESGQLRFGGRDRPFNAPFNKKLYAENKFKIDTRTPDYKEKFNPKAFNRRDLSYSKYTLPKKEYRDRLKSRSRSRSRSRNRNRRNNY